MGEAGEAVAGVEGEGVEGGGVGLEAEEAQGQAEEGVVREEDELGAEEGGGEEHCVLGEEGSAAQPARGVHGQNQIISIRPSSSTSGRSRCMYRKKSLLPALTPSSSSHSAPTSALGSEKTRAIELSILFSLIQESSLTNSPSRLSSSSSSAGALVVLCGSRQPILLPSARRKRWACLGVPPRAQKKWRCRISFSRTGRWMASGSSRPILTMRRRSRWGLWVGISLRKRALSRKTLTARSGRLGSRRCLMMKPISQGLYHSQCCLRGKSWAEAWVMAWMEKGRSELSQVRERMVLRGMCLRRRRQLPMAICPTLSMQPQPLSLSQQVLSTLLTICDLYVNSRYFSYYFIYYPTHPPLRVSISPPPQTSLPPPRTTMNNTFLRSLKDCELSFEKTGSAVLVRQLSGQGSPSKAMGKYEISQIPELYRVFFADVGELFEELRIVAQDNLEFSQERLLYSMPTASKSIKLAIPLRKLTLSETEQLQALNQSLKGELARLQALYDDKCAENKTLQEQIYSLQRRVSDLESKSTKLSSVFEQEKDSSMIQRSQMVAQEEKSQGKRGAPQGLYWPQVQGGSKRAKLDVAAMERFNFEPDSSHPNFGSFQWQNNQLKHTASSIGLYRTITSATPIREKGRTAVEWRVLKDSFNSILFGLLREEDRLKESKEGESIQLSLKNERLYLRGLDGDSEELMSGVRAGERIQLVVNLDSETLSVLRNSCVLHSAELRGQLRGSRWVVFASMSCKGEVIEFM